MKKKSLLTAIVILSVLLVGIGTSYAIYGVPDDVPGRDLVWPVICAETPGPNPASDNTALTSLNTNWAIADLGSSLLGANNIVDASGNAVTASCALFDRRSHLIFDFDYAWTPFDVVTDDCQSLLGRHPSSKTLDNDGIPGIDLEVTIDGVKYFAGYVTCTQEQITPVGFPIVPQPLLVNRFMNNVYLVDLPLGFASGFNGPSLEDGAGSLFGEAGGAFHIAARDIFARYFVNNDLSNTWDWWILLLGRNQYSLTDVLTSSRSLTGVLYDEYEHVSSLVIPIPYELNIITVDPLLPGAPFFVKPGDTVQSFPKAGFGSFTVTETGTRSVAGSFTITGTANQTEVGNVGIPFYSLFGWSYERAAAASNILGDFDVMHPMFRTYCTGAVSGGGAADNIGLCSCVGTGCSAP